LCRGVSHTPAPSPAVSHTPAPDRIEIMNIAV
jgi:hypothetical protein